MTEVRRAGDLELEQDWQYQHRSWTFERVGWTVVALIAIAALLGLTGSGWLSQAQMGQVSDPVWLEYERFGRFQAPEKLRVHINTTFANRQIQIGISRQYLEGVKIQQVTPEPDRVDLSANYLTYSFGGTAPTAVTFYLEPEQIGLLPGSVALGGQSLQFQQLVYP